VASRATEPSKGNERPEPKLRDAHGSSELAKGVDSRISSVKDPIKPQGERFGAGLAR